MLTLAIGLAPSACKDNSKSDQSVADEAKPDQPVSDQPPANAGEPAAPTDLADPADPIQAAIAHSGRAAEDRARDADRKPAAVLEFYDIQPGMKVADLMADTGYYTELLARVVGADGVVYAQNNAWLIERFGDDKLKQKLAREDLGNIRYQVSELEALELPAGELDAVFLVLFYHDTYWLGTDRAKMNQAVFDALKPGGVYAIIDHHAEAGSKDRDVKTIHRMDAELLKAELSAAGFVFDGESEALKNPDDDRSQLVFDEALRGKTDRFVYRFRKPRS
ncbi:MAG: class I SAM-dependent methyltransferase [Haliangiales bacterium]